MYVWHRPTRTLNDHQSKETMHRKAGDPATRPRIKRQFHKSKNWCRLKPTFSLEFRTIVVSWIVLVGGASLLLGSSSSGTTALAAAFVIRSSLSSSSWSRRPYSTTTSAAMSQLSSLKSDQDTEGDVRTQSPQRIVIAGAGMIGTATAYYLAKLYHRSQNNNRSIHITIVDPTGTIAPAASGKAGGFLALDWNDGGPTEQLTRRSFALHQELANELGAESIQYRRLTCAAISVHPTSSQSAGRKPRGSKLVGIEWAQPQEGAGSSSANMMIDGVRPLGDERTIAQVHPNLLCNRLWEETVKLTNGAASLVKGKVVSIVHDENGTLQGAQLDDDDETVLPADSLLFACGPWTATMMMGIKYHSAIIPTDRVLHQCVFFSGCGDPEVYVRPDSTAYCTGFPDDATIVTEEPGQECVRPEAISQIVKAVRDATGGGRVRGGTDHASNGGALASDPAIQQACYLPTTSDGIPVMGEIPVKIAGASRCYIATGHTCWGILLGPATGECMAHLVATGTATSSQVDIRRFDPKRFSTFQLVPTHR